MKRLVDTNIFLEIFLSQARRGDCEQYLNQHIGYLYLSDFTLHSIGVILFKRGKYADYQQFTIDILPKVQLLSLPQNQYFDLPLYASTYGLDFDDTYQFAIAKEYDLTIATMDTDFRKVAQMIPIEFI
ncbi:MAG: PIN domain-containing protein [Saprospiraceae bacterium]|nr:PIN domain-containing protein [Saprospiraceae bacterium]